VGRFRPINQREIDEGDARGWVSTCS